LMINSSTGMTDTVWIVVRTSILGGSHAFLARLLKVTHQVKIINLTLYYGRYYYRISHRYNMHNISHNTNEVTRLSTENHVNLNQADAASPIHTAFNRSVEEANIETKVVNDQTDSTVVGLLISKRYITDIKDATSLALVCKSFRAGVYKKDLRNLQRGLVSFKNYSGEEIQFEITANTTVSQVMKKLALAHKKSLLESKEKILSEEELSNPSVILLSTGIEYTHIKGKEADPKEKEHDPKAFSVFLPKERDDNSSDKKYSKLFADFYVFKSG
ncbi:MAG: hypothetical protein PUP46_10360, partial [Endozoicomonas sp. (ex Botrylloides leachii)]|nr:hypothetical protein [Endozoicomonas sp. (ex Botrylloides leachii)]